jgi:hypothetical protein
MVKIQTLEEIRAKRNRNQVGLPPRERWGEQVPHGGTMCANCEYLKDRDNRICSEPNFIAWEGPNKPVGSDKIPGEISSYCSIWWSNGSK